MPKCVFGNLPEQLLRQFCEIGEIRWYSAGLTIVRQGDEPHGVFKTAEVVEDCILEYAPRRKFVPFLLQNPQVAVELLIWLSQEYQGLQLSLGDAVSRPTLSVQLLRQLRRLGEACGEETASLPTSVLSSSGVSERRTENRPW